MPSEQLGKDALAEAVQRKIDMKTKPHGALGMLEDLAKQICIVQQTLTPELKKPAIVVFAADHGIAAHGVSAYPATVTAQMVQNFLQGGAAINVFCRQHDIRLKIVDAGVDFEFTPHPDLVDAKVASGTENFLNGNALTAEQLKDCFERAAYIVDEIAGEGSNIIGFGEMGIGNTSAASLLMSVLCNIPVQECTGAGTGLDNVQLENKIRILEQVRQNHPVPADVPDALQMFGGFEIAQMCGAMLRSYEKGMLIMVDGFIATAAFLCAYKMNPAIKDHAVFCHLSDEQAHRRLLQFLEARPVLQLGMRLGEGTGCAIAFPILRSAVNFINEMASFKAAGIDDKL